MDDGTTRAAMFAATSEKNWTLVMPEQQLAQQPNQQARTTVNGVDVMLVKVGARLYAMQVC